MSTEKLLDAWLRSNGQSRRAYISWQTARERRGANDTVTLQIYRLYRASRNQTLRLQRAILARAPQN